MRELRDIAKRRIPAATFDYVDGGSFGEHSLNRNRAAFNDVEFVPHVLRDVTSVDLRTKIAGTESALPVGFGPTGLTRLMHTEGEIWGAQAEPRLARSHSRRAVVGGVLLAGRAAPRSGSADHVMAS